MDDLTRRFLTGSITPVDPAPLPLSIRPEEPLFFAGSCFAENLYRFWQDHYLPAGLSPFGNTYNPLSLLETFRRLFSDEPVREEELFFHQDLWRHSLFDTFCTGPEKGPLLEELNSLIRSGKEQLKQSRVLVLTAGTAFVYREAAGGDVVNNCHKRPGGDFIRECLSFSEIRDALEELCALACREIPGIRIILTLSPVRHLRDSPEENSLSKALLRCALAELCRDREECSYFPSYEIMMDELRDYRWYADDLSHPSGRAVEYIMNRFCGAAESQELKDYLKEAEKLRKKRNHRLRFPDSPEGRRFEKRVTMESEAFLKRFPFAGLN